MNHVNDTLDTPDDFRLLDGEKILNVQLFKSTLPPSRISSLSEIYRLTNSTNISEIGANGPIIAALTSESNLATHNGQGLFNVVFGRDSLRVALDLIKHFPKLASATIRKLAELQGTDYDISSEEEPGRIPHEIRNSMDPIAIKMTKERGWNWPYYGSVDATPEFIRTLGAFCKLSDQNLDFLSEKYFDKDGNTQTIADALVHAVDWMLSRMKNNPEGLLEFKSSIENGIENQVWKDSWDAYHHSDGTIANHDQGIASIEVQTVSHDALLDAADLYDTGIIGRHDEAKQLREQAEVLSKRILEIFWTDDKGGYFVIGTDRNDSGNLRQLKVRTSNMGHVLNSRVIDGDDEDHTRKRLAILKQLQSPEMLAVGGIRTLASDEVRFREGAYHNGSVWIWDTHHIAKGARRHADNPEFEKFANDLDDRILNVVNIIEEFPEYIRGGNKIAVNTRTIDVYDSIAGRINRVEQPPQEVQAWTVAAILASQWHDK
ncbi:MAG TPA: amylo-alpha-1,6-glucosidase [Candidatus Saccharimonadales bacterium]|nr:amylo-alpha-1,6-glucosidase [Candidatus Saccharimonadales bacterium]